MKKIIISVLFIIVILLGKGEAHAQTSLPKDNFCQPSAEEVLLIIESVYKWSTNGKTFQIPLFNFTKKSFSQRPIIARKPID